MSTLTRRFTWTNHSETGLIGWLPVACADDPLFLPSMGLGVAHDTLEHFSMDGSMEDECLAFGSLYFIRIETGRLRDFEHARFTPAQTFGSDLCEMFRSNDYADLKDPGRVLPSLNTSDMWTHRDAMRLEFIRMVHSEGADDGVFEVSEYRTAEEVATFEQSIGEWFDRAFLWMTLGYRKAMRRWNGHGHNSSLANSTHACYEAADLFWELAKTIDRDYGENDYRQEGDTLAVHVNIRRRSFNIICSTPNY